MKLLSLLTLAGLPAAVYTQAQIPFQASPKTSSSLDIPHLGFGTWNLKSDYHNASKSVASAIVAGYRHIDCAAAYGNEKDVGAGIATGILGAGIKRSDLWITSKLWNDHHVPKDVETGLNKTLQDLGLHYLDLYLMHWPVSSSQGKNKEEYLDTWHAMEKLLDTGRVKNIGVANFSPAQLSDLVKLSAHKPAVHQMELHPYLPQTEWIQWHHMQGIHVTAYSPLGDANPTYGDKKRLLEDKAVKKVAKARGCTPAQVILSWGLSRGTSVIPKSAHVERIEENFGSTDCNFEYEDIVALGKLGHSVGPRRFNNPSEGWGVGLFKGLEDV